MPVSLSFWCRFGLHLVPDWASPLRSKFDALLTFEEDNKGLANRVTALNGLYDSLTNVKAVMSRADFWMLAMVVALEQGNGGKGIPVCTISSGAASAYRTFP